MARPLNASNDADVAAAHQRVALPVKKNGRGDGSRKAYILQRPRAGTGASSEPVAGFQSNNRQTALCAVDLGGGWGLREASL